MKQAQIIPLTIQQYAKISEQIYDEIERIEHADITAAKCIGHPEYGDIILISSNDASCVMIRL